MKRHNKAGRRKSRGVIALIFCITLLILCVLLCIYYFKFYSSRWLVQTVNNEKYQIMVLEPETVSANSNASISNGDASDYPEEEEVFEDYSIKLMSLGDQLMHMGVVYTGKQEDGSLDYSCLYDGIRDFLDVADIKVMNQETILGGNSRGFSGYPHFNSPTEVGEALYEAGFNVVLHASNHTADQGLEGIKNCSSFWKNYPDVCVVGMQGEDDLEVVDYYLESEDTDGNIPIIDIKGIKFAILNYTYGPNAEIIDKRLMGHINFLCNYNSNGLLDFTEINPQVIEDIKTAKEEADIVIVFPHWGTEYVTEPSIYQKEFAKQMAEAGADLIIGTHPHVIQPVEWIYSDNGNKTLCFYSLGNYVSTQKDCISMLEAMAWVEFKVTEEGVSIDEDKTGAIPMVCQYTNAVRIDRVYMLEDYTDELAKKHGITSYGGKVLKLENLNTWADDILGEFKLSYQKVLE